MPVRRRRFGPCSLVAALMASAGAAQGAVPTGAAACAEPTRELAVLADERSIARLLDEYIWRLDSRDFSGYGELFAHGAILGADGKVIAQGAHEVTAMVRHYLGAPPEALVVRHITSSPRIEVNTDGRTASARSFVMTVRAPAGKPAYIFRVASYHDRFEKVDGRWRFASRQELTDWVQEEYSSHYSRDATK